MYHTVESHGAAPSRRTADLLHAFEAGRFPDGPFPHADHVRLAHAYLVELGLVETLRRYPPGLRALAERLGAPGKYHETVTWALIVLIHERLAATETVPGWEAFAARNPDLLRWEDGPLFDVYPREIMISDLARRTFVLPR